MNQIPNIEETHNTREVEEIVAQLLLRTYDRCFVRGRVPPEVGSSIAHYDLFLKEELTNLLHHQLQKAREEVINSVIITVLNSRTLEETTGIGVRESTARAQVCVDIRTKLLDHSELDHQPDRPLNSERD